MSVLQLPIYTSSATNRRTPEQLLSSTVQAVVKSIEGCGEGCLVTAREINIDIDSTAGVS